MATNLRPPLHPSYPQAGLLAPAAHPPVGLRGAHMLCEALIREGVDTIFSYPGGAVLHLYNELIGVQDRLKHVLVRHEQGAVHMAEGYARATGRVGVAGVTSGPGAANAAFVGDGGFQMTSQELATAVKYRTDLTFVPTNRQRDVCPRLAQ